MKPHVKSAQNKAAIGMIILADKEGDRHAVPVPQVRCLTDWKREWGDDVAAVVLYDSGPFPSVLRVRMGLEELTQVFQAAAAGKVLDLTAFSGPQAYEKKENGDATMRARIKSLLTGVAGWPVPLDKVEAPSLTPVPGKEDGSRQVASPVASAPAAIARPL